MKLPRGWAFGWILLVPGLGALPALALDAPHSLHHTRPSQTHLVKSHRRAAHHSAAAAGHASKSAPQSIVAHTAAATHAAAKSIPAGQHSSLTAATSTRGRVRRASLTRRH